MFNTVVVLPTFTGGVKGGLTCANVLATKSDATVTTNNNIAAVGAKAKINFLLNLRRTRIG